MKLHFMGYGFQVFLLAELHTSNHRVGIQGYKADARGLCRGTLGCSFALAKKERSCLLDRVPSTDASASFAFNCDAMVPAIGSFTLQSLHHFVILGILLTLSNPLLLCFALL